MILFDWICPKHGVFECSHPICPAQGCLSEGVTKTFIKPPGFKSDATKRFDAETRKSAEMAGLSNFRSAHAGESSRIREQAAPGGELLWGNEVNKVFPQQGFAGLMQGAAAQSTFKKPDGSTETVPSGMKLAAQSGLTSDAALRPKAIERTVHKTDKGG